MIKAKETRIQTPIDIVQWEINNYEKYFYEEYKYKILVYPNITYQQDLEKDSYVVVLANVIRELGIKKSDYDHGYKRGIYFSSFYENGRDFLRGEIDDSDLKMRKQFVEGYDYINRWWKRKALRRYTKLHTENRLKPEMLYYSDMLGMTWEEAKEKYLGDIGR